MISNGWIRIDNSAGSGGAAIAATILSRNTGRSETRTATVVGATNHGAEATAVFSQDPSPQFIIIDHMEKDGSPVSQLAVEGGSYFVVGYSNVDFMTISETSEDYTDWNNVEQGEAWSDGFNITEHGNTHQHMQLESSIQYGTDEQYVFAIPCNILAGVKTSRTVTIYIENEDGDASAIFSIVQAGELD